MRYTLMHRQFPVAELEMNEYAVITDINKVHSPERLPAGIDISETEKFKTDLNYWLRSRVIPRTRQGAQAIREALGTSEFSSLLTKSLALSLSDQYWINPEDNPFRWEKVNFFDNPFSPDMGELLFNDFPYDTDFDNFDFRSPDITTNGNLKKRWEGNRLFKGGTGPFHQEPLNEEIATVIMQKLNIPHVRYFTVWRKELPYSVCENFITRNTELVSAWQIEKVLEKNNGVSSRQHFLNCCDKLGIPGVRESIDKMLILDYLIENEDRHWGNFGAVRNAHTLEWQGLAPVFDCGNSLWYNKNNTAIGTLNLMRNKPFCNSHEEHIEQITDFSELDISALDGIKNECSKLLSQSPFIDKSRRNALCDALISRVELLGEHIQSHNTQYFISNTEQPDEENEEDLEP